MRRRSIGMGVAATCLLANAGVGGHMAVTHAAPVQVQSVSCVKKVRSGKKVITKKTCLADIKGNRQNLNDILSIGVVLGDWPDWNGAHAHSFLAPAHFQVKWSVSCALEGDGSHRLAMFYVIAYDGKYQSQELYTAYNAGAKHGTTDVDTSGVKRWTFMVSDAEKQGCSYRLTAKKISL